MMLRPAVIIKVGDGNLTCYVDIEAPDLDAVVSETEELCKQLLDLTLQQLVDTDGERVEVQIRYELLGLEKSFKQNLTFEEFESRKKAPEPERPKLNLESLQNDIEYGLNMIRSGMAMSEVAKYPGVMAELGWFYHVLQKHFGLAIPNEFSTAVAQIDSGSQGSSV